MSDQQQPADTGDVERQRFEMGGVSIAGLDTSHTCSRVLPRVQKLWAGCENLTKDKTAEIGQGRKYRYLGQAQLVEMVRKLASGEELLILQPIEVGDHCVSVRTIIVHGPTGEWIATRGLRVPVGQATAQAIGSAATYAKRYDLCALLCIAADEDDDAQAAMPPATNSGKGAKASTTTAAPKTNASRAATSSPATAPAGQPSTKDELAQLFAALTPPEAEVWKNEGIGADFARARKEAPSVAAVDAIIVRAAELNPSPSAAWKALVDAVARSARAKIEARASTKPAAPAADTNDEWGLG